MSDGSAFVKNHVLNYQLDSSDGTHVKQKSASGAAYGYESSVGAGDANESSYFESYKRVKKPVVATTLASSVAAQNIGASGTTPVFLSGLYIALGTTGLAGTLTVSGFANPGGTASTFTIPAGTTGRIDFGGDLQMDNGCQMTCSVTADSVAVAVAWRNQ